MKLFFETEAVKQRLAPFVQPDLVHVTGQEDSHEVLGPLENLLRIYQNLTDIRRKDIPKHPEYQVVFLVQLGGGRLCSALLLNDAPHVCEVSKILLKVLFQLFGARRSDDDSCVSLWGEFRYQPLETFPFILDEIGDEHRGKRFAIIIDEAHSSQGGKTSAKMHMALSDKGGEDDEEETFEDKINTIMESRKMLANASYFAFTATPKNKTLEIFGIPGKPVDGKIPHRPFHSYTMKQAIQEGFILDVLAHYTPVDTWSRLAKEVEDDPEFDTKKALKKLLPFLLGD